MADDDVLQAKLFSFICGNGGFVDLADLLKSSSPLVSRKCEESAKKWLERRQGPWAGFACVKDKNGEIVGVRVDLGKKICHRYATQGVCRLRRCKQGNCKYWHICKTFVEGRCNEFCELSHDFYSDDNWEIAEALNLPDDKYSNESMKKIVSWNLPQVCELYQRNECTWSECPYIHVCTQFIKGSSHSNCFLSHDFEDSHNFTILEKYDFIQSSQEVNIDFVRFNVLIVEDQKRINTAFVSSDPASEQNQPSSLFTAGIREEIDQVNTAQVPQILVLEEQQVDESVNRKMPRAASINFLPAESALETTRLKSNMSRTSNAVDSQTSLSSSQRINTAVVGSDPASEQNQLSSLFTAEIREEIDQVNTARVAQILVCEEQQVDELLNCKMPRAASINHLPTENALETTRLKSNMLTASAAVDSQTSLSSLQRINTAVVGSNPASEQNQPSSLFTAGIREEIDQVNTAQVAQILVCEEHQVDELLNCKMPRAASINHLPTENALETTRLKSNMLTASAAVDSQTSLSSLQRINTAVVGSNPASEQNQPSSLFTAGIREEIDQVNTAQVAQILVCEEQQVDESVNRKIRRAASTNDLPAESASEKTPLKSNMLTTSTAVDSQTSLPSSQTLEVSEFKSSVPSTHCLLTERRVFECLCKEYGSSASIQDIAGRKDLFPKGVESAEEWFREMTRGSLLITRGSQGTIAEVSAFSARARICVSYNENGKCHRSDCSFLHICKGFVTGSCSNGERCLRKHHLNDRDKAFLGRIKLDQFNDQQLRQLVLSSTPRICVEYNNGVCDRGDDCNRIHMCCGHIRKCCSAKSICGLDHEEAMDTKHTQAVLRRYLLHNVEKREAIAMILDDKLCLSGKEKAKGQYFFVLFLFTY